MRLNPERVSQQSLGSPQRGAPQVMLVGLWIAAFVQEARWLNDARWRMGNTIAARCDLVISVGPACRAGLSPQGRDDAQPF